MGGISDGNYDNGLNFGLVDIDWDAAGGPTVTIQGVGVDGQAFYQHTIAHHELVPSRLNDTEERAYRTDCAYERVYTNAGSVKVHAFELAVLSFAFIAVR